MRLKISKKLRTANPHLKFAGSSQKKRVRFNLHCSNSLRRFLITVKLYYSVFLMLRNYWAKKHTPTHTHHL